MDPTHFLAQAQCDRPAHKAHGAGEVDAFYQTVSVPFWWKLGAVFRKLREKATTVSSGSKPHGRAGHVHSFPAE